MSVGAAEELIKQWKLYHGEWWELLMEADFGDMVDGIRDQHRYIGLFYKGADNKLKMHTYLSSEQHLELELTAQELLNTRQAISASKNPLREFIGSGAYGTGEEKTHDIMLLRAVNNKYVPVQGTGVFYAETGISVPSKTNWANVGLGVGGVSLGIVGAVGIAGSLAICLLDSPVPGPADVVGLPLLWKSIEAASAYTGGAMLLNDEFQKNQQRSRYATYIQ